MPNQAFPAILWGMKTMSYNNALTIYPDSICLHPDLKVFVRSDGAVWSNKSGWIYGTKRTTGYLCVCIAKRSILVHKIVAEAFLTNPDNKPTVDHIDRVRTNNSVDNLRFATYREQRDNSSQVLNSQDIGVRYCDNPKEYSKRNAKVWYENHKNDPSWLDARRRRQRINTANYRAKRKASLTADLP